MAARHHRAALPIGKTRRQRAYVALAEVDFSPKSRETVASLLRPERHRRGKSDLLVMLDPLPQ